MPDRQEAATLEAYLRHRTIPGALCERLEENRIRCLACAHRCVIPNGRSGICKVRFNRDGELRVPYGYVASVQFDPIEKKPFFHALPGALALSFGILGRDYHCSFCQNWITSQALRDEAAGSPVKDVSPELMVNRAVEVGAQVVTSTYNEPLITSEWAVAVFELAHEVGLMTSFVSNGNATPEVLAYLAPHLDYFKVDLKAFTKQAYREVGGRLEPVLEAIRMLWEMGKWVEVVTLLIPGMNDSDGEMAEMAGFLAGVSPDIPWHVTAFRPEYRLHSPGSTPLESLKRGVRHGREAGLHHVYAGNMPGLVGDAEHTRCPSCGKIVIERYGFRILSYRLEGSRCPHCGGELAGRWPSEPIRQESSIPFLL